MTKTRVSVAEAKQHLADLLGRVAYGKERVMITRRGKPMAILVPVGHESTPRHLADARGWLESDDPFFSTLTKMIENRRTHPPRTISSQA